MNRQQKRPPPRCGTSENPHSVASATELRCTKCGTDVRALLTARDRVVKTVVAFGNTDEKR